MASSLPRLVRYYGLRIGTGAVLPASAQFSQTLTLAWICGRRLLSFYFTFGCPALLVCWFSFTVVGALQNHLGGHEAGWGGGEGPGGAVDAEGGGGGGLGWEHKLGQHQLACHAGA